MKAERQPGFSSLTSTNASLSGKSCPQPNDTHAREGSFQFQQSYPFDSVGKDSDSILPPLVNRISVEFSTCPLLCSSRQTNLDHTVRLIGRHEDLVRIVEPERRQI